MPRSNREIVEENMALIEECLKYQFVRAKTEWEYMDDFRQDLYLILLTYDNEKLNNAYDNNHLNALITRMIRNQIHSDRSPYYDTYKKFKSKSNNLTIRELNIPDNEIG